MAAIVNPDTGEVSRKDSLFSLGDELEAIYEAYNRLEGEDAEAYINAALEKYFEQKSSDLNNKLDGYCGLIKTAEAKAKIRKAEAARLNDLAQTDSNFADRLKKRLKDWMQFTGNQKLETTYHKIWTQNNGGVLPLVWLHEVDGQSIPTPEPPSVESLPDVYLTKVVDVEAIRADLEAGEELPFAKIGERGVHLRIK